MLAQSLELSLRQTGEQGPCDKSSWESGIFHQRFPIHLQPDKDGQNPIINMAVKLQVVHKKLWRFPEEKFL